MIKHRYTSPIYIRNHKIFFLALSLSIVSLPCFAQQQKPQSQDGKRAQVFHYTNPITRDTAIAMRDHFIIKVDKLWYCVGTSEPVWTGPNPGVRLLISEDLINWKQHSWLIDAGKLPPESPYNGRFWAPEIHYIQNKYWLTVNSGKVTKDDPKGMQTQQNPSMYLSQHTMRAECFTSKAQHGLNKS